MRKIYFLIVFSIVGAVSFGQVIATDNFTYSDGPLVPNGGWETHSGTTGNLLIVQGKALVQHGTPDEDANLPFTPVNSGNIYYSFDFSVNNPGGAIAGSDNEYFAHFKTSGTGFFGRMSIVPPSANGDFAVGIATGSEAAVAWPTDFSYDITYRAIVRYSVTDNTSQLWINATSISDASISGTSGTTPGSTIASFALRQSDSNLNEGILVDNLIVSSTFEAATLTTNDFNVKSFTVYPNPSTTGYVTIGSPSKSELTIAIFDVLGKKVMTSTVVNNRLNVSRLNSGVYLIKITQNGASITKKLIIK